MSSAHTPGICASLIALALAAPSPAAVTQAELDALRAGSAGVELAGIVVATIDRQGRLQTLASGCARFAANGRDCAQPLRPDGLMRIASISKMVTAAEVLRLVRRRHLALDQDVSSLLGFEIRNPAFPRQAITVRQLLNHTSSIVDGEQYWLPWPQVIDATTASTHRFDPDHGPGSFFRYSNFNYVLLGQMLERVSRQRFDRLMQQDQFKPQSLVAGYNWRIAQPFDPGRIVTLYRRQAEGQSWNPAGPWIPQVDDFAGAPPAPNPDLRQYRIGTNGSVFSPHGGLRIALPDLARWLSPCAPRQSCSVLMAAMATAKAVFTGTSPSASTPASCRVWAWSGAILEKPMACGRRCCATRDPGAYGPMRSPAMAMIPTGSPARFPGSIMNSRRC
jgi:CubicO group peptidase (beta-lactamase class C family)